MADKSDVSKRQRVDYLQGWLTLCLSAALFHFI